MGFRTFPGSTGELASSQETACQLRKPPPLYGAAFVKEAKLLKIQFAGGINRIWRLAKAGFEEGIDGEERRQQPAGVAGTPGTFLAALKPTANHKQTPLPAQALSLSSWNPPVPLSQPSLVSHGRLPFLLWASVSPMPDKKIGLVSLTRGHFRKLTSQDPNFSGSEPPRTEDFRILRCPDFMVTECDKSMRTDLEVI